MIELLWLQMKQLQSRECAISDMSLKRIAICLDEDHAIFSEIAEHHMPRKMQTMA